MNRFLLLVLFALLFGTPMSSYAQLGVAAGLNFESMSEVTGDAEATFENSTGYHVGIFYDLGMGPISVRLGGFYRDVSDVETTRNGVIDAFDLTMVDVPVDVRFNLTATPLVHPYILAGPVFSFPSSTDTEYDKALEKVSVSGNVGAGLAFNLGAVTIYPEVRYVIGVSRFMKDQFEIGGVSFDSEEVQRQNSVMIRLGVGF